MEFIFYAINQKLDNIKCTFIDNNTDNPSRLFINFDAKVLGDTQGTPMLRNGVTLITTHNQQHSSNAGHHADKAHFSFM